MKKNCGLLLEGQWKDSLENNLRMPYKSIYNLYHPIMDLGIYSTELKMCSFTKICSNTFIPDLFAVTPDRTKRCLPQVSG